MGDVLLEAGKPEEARAMYQDALTRLERSELSSGVKENARLVHQYNLGHVAVQDQVSQFVSSVEPAAFG